MIEHISKITMNLVFKYVLVCTFASLLLLTIYVIFHSKGSVQKVIKKQFLSNAVKSEVL